MLSGRTAAPGLAYTVPCSDVDILLKTGSAHLPTLYKQPGNTHRQTGRKILEVSGIAHMPSETVYRISIEVGEEKVQIQSFLLQDKTG